MRSKIRYDGFYISFFKEHNSSSVIILRFESSGYMKVVHLHDFKRSNLDDLLKYIYSSYVSSEPNNWIRCLESYLSYFYPYEREGKFEILDDESVKIVFLLDEYDVPDYPGERKTEENNLQIDETGLIWDEMKYEFIEKNMPTIYIEPSAEGICEVCELDTLAIDLSIQDILNSIDFPLSVKLKNKHNFPVDYFADDDDIYYWILSK